MEKILVTGNLGYIGKVLTKILLDEDYFVKGVDTEYFNDKRLFNQQESAEFIQLKKDIRLIERKDLEGIDHIIHLAALSNDPLGELNPILTTDINLNASIRIARMAKSVGVKRFLFSSSCSIYGQTNNESLNEMDEMNPLTAYAKTKVACENQLSELADDSFSPVYLRNGTAYGISPSMRFDLVINNLMGWAYTTKEIKILSDGRAWRPIVHIQDISNAFLACLKAPRDDIHNQAFNVGINSENYQVRTMANEIKKQMTDCEIKILGKDNPDQRNYIVNFNKINKSLSYFNPQWDLKKGISEILTTFNEINFNSDLFQDRHFTRIKQLNFLINNDILNDKLYWKEKVNDEV